MTTASINYVLASTKKLKVGTNKFDLYNVGIGVCDGNTGECVMVEDTDNDYFTISIDREVPSTLIFILSYMDASLGYFFSEWRIIKVGDEIFSSSPDETFINTRMDEEGNLVIATRKYIAAIRQFIGYTATISNDLSEISNQSFFISQYDVISTTDILDNYNNQYRGECRGPSIKIIVNTDQLGLNLGESLCIIWSKHEYPNGYPKRLIGKNDGLILPKEVNGLVQTLYSARPRLRKVLLGKGNTLFAQTNFINKKFDTGLSNSEFFGRILSYSALRYFLSGLIFGKFKTAWLYKQYYKKFLIDLKGSHFKKYLPLFINPKFGFVGFEKYYKLQ